MSPRPRTHSDTEILEAAAHVIGQKPGDWTLQNVGDFVGLDPATLVQRFGSKHDLEMRVLAYMNQHDDDGWRMAVGDLIVVSCNGDRHRAGLLAFRLRHAISNDPEARFLAMGSAR